MTLGALASAAGIVAFAGVTSANAVTTYIYTEEAGAPLETAVAGDPVQTAWTSVGKPAGTYEDYLIFDVMRAFGTDNNFEVTLSETDSGSSKASFYSAGTTLALYACSAPNCGYTDSTHEPTGGTFKGSAPVGPIPNGHTAFSQGAFLDVQDLPLGWYYIALTGPVSAPDGTSFIPAVTATVYGTAVPEAPAWAMFGLGFAGIGLAGFHRRKGARYAL